MGTQPKKLNNLGPAAFHCIGQTQAWTISLSSQIPFPKQTSFDLMDPSSQIITWNRNFSSHKYHKWKTAWQNLTVKHEKICFGKGPQGKENHGLRAPRAAPKKGPKRRRFGARARRACSPGPLSIENLFVTTGDLLECSECFLGWPKATSPVVTNKFSLERGPGLHARRARAPKRLRFGPFFGAARAAMILFSLRTFSKANLFMFDCKILSCCFPFMIFMGRKVSVSCDYLGWWVHQIKRCLFWKRDLGW